MSKRWSGVTATVVASLVLLACGGIATEADDSDVAKLEQQSAEAGLGHQCGDRECDGNERVTCPSDCPASCGNGICEVGENQSTCPTDCGYSPYCGDGVCGAGENCPVDCGPMCLTPKAITPPPQDENFIHVCGDGYCEVNEYSNCPRDCCA
ncbi:hypothetical protein FJV41_22655 [Myxococcus llanfairpwllgwyngyllgogerychwyrndrobwllllantysiliogogogochensis]|uniref:Lipoprotein n=1 Tax=Myxococcus llanfairpwllgwyngyllgogerychwyrndrobwllllantysiliogogogochensis TaxID=2590453 RepID=A0A540WYW9_9BACT|nr:hypothetical protein [Myxococcus llanfairpwllgwyngyllgogerychwyrndrobwllllantysiliogogogochensis]TQF13664.1 hypothetical protein FJV41_22655 [Myxococcus llanfairpwllgwyngyllgogerychwyrndrobwllllantysiliogogogochensis]